MLLHEIKKDIPPTLTLKESLDDREEMKLRLKEAKKNKEKWFKPILFLDGK